MDSSVLIALCGLMVSAYNAGLAYNNGEMSGVSGWGAAGILFLSGVL